MPSRVIKESCRSSKTLDRLSAEAERLFWRLTTCADDFGRFEADPVILLANCFPRRVDNFSAAMVEGWYQELEQAGLVASYLDDDRQLGFFVKWRKHQTCRAKESKFPEPKEVKSVLQASASECKQMLPGSGSGSGSGSGTRAGSTRAREVPPTPEPGPPPEAGSLRASAPGNPKPKPKTPNLGPPPAVTDEQAERIDGLRQRLHARDRPGAGRLDLVVMGFLGRGGPPEVLIAGLESTVEHQPGNAVAYLEKILRVEEPNHHEARAIEQGKGFTQAMQGMGLKSLQEAAERAAKQGGGS